jgi:hypothetical protein
MLSFIHISKLIRNVSIGDRISNALMNWDDSQDFSPKEIEIVYEILKSPYFQSVPYNSYRKLIHSYNN